MSIEINSPKLRTQLQLINMTIEELLKHKPIFFYYEEAEQEDYVFDFTFSEVKQVVKSHNRDNNTEYKTINEFNDGEYNKKIEIT